MDSFGILLCKFDLKDIFFYQTTMDHIGKPVEINRKFIKFMEQEIQPEYERVLEKLVQQIKEQLDEMYDPKNIDEKYLKKDKTNNT